MDINERHIANTLLTDIALGPNRSEAVQHYKDFIEATLTRKRIENRELHSEASENRDKKFYVLRNDGSGAVHVEAGSFGSMETARGYITSHLTSVPEQLEIAEVTDNGANERFWGRVI